MKTVICIDPGAKGAFAIMSEGRVYCEDMPETIGDLWFYFKGPYPKFAKDLTAYMENVGQYVPGNSGPGAVKFARHCGHLEAFLLAAEIPCEKVSPNVWMRGIGCPPKLSKQDRKRWIKDYAQRRYPSVKVTLQNADALGMLAYVTGRRGDGP